MRKCFEKEYIYLTHTLNRDNPNFSYKYLIQSDIPCNVGDVVVITSQHERYAIAEVIDSNETYTVDNDNYVVEYDESKTRYNDNSVVFKINDCPALKLYREKQAEKNTNRTYFDSSIESILALFGDSLAAKKTESKIKNLMDEYKNTEGDKYWLKNNHIMITNEKYQSLFSAKDELNCIFFDGNTIYYERVSKTQKIETDNEISNHSNKVLSLLLGTVDEITEPELLKQAVRGVTRAKLKEFANEYSDMLKLFTIQEIIDNCANIPIFNDFVSRRREIINQMMKENQL